MSVNPLIWAHYKLTGGRRSHVLTVVIYAGLIAVAVGLSYQAVKPTEYRWVTSVWLGLVTGAQALLAFLLVPMAIRRAVMRDFQSGMIESHRLAPMGNGRIVLGYLAGPPLQAAWLLIVGLAAGTCLVTALSVGGSWRDPIAWWAFHGYLLVVTLLVAALVLLTALATGGKANFLAIAFVAGIFGGWLAVVFVPGLALLSGVTLVAALPEPVVRGATFLAPDEAAAVLAGILGQLALAVLFIKAACRKVRAPHRPIFDLPLGLVLLVVWAGALIVGVALPGAFEWLYEDWGDIASAQLVASTAAFMVVALFPLLAAVSDCVRRDRARVLGGVELRGGRGIAVLMPCLLGAATVATLLLMASFVSDTRIPGLVWVQRGWWPEWPELARLVAMVAACMLAFWINFNILYLFVARGAKVLLVAVLSLVLLQALPLLVDWVVLAVLEELDRALDYVDLYAAGFSPIGTVLLCLSAGGNPWPGLAGQVVLGGLAWLVGRRARQQLVAARGG
jgi:hypothetical protein